MGTRTRIQPHQIQWFYVRKATKDVPDRVLVVLTNPTLWDTQWNTFNPHQIDGLDTIPERKVTYPQARRLWPKLAPIKCPSCAGYGADPEEGTCDECNPRCLDCGKRFSAINNDGRKCRDCARPTSWTRIMSD